MKELIFAGFGGQGVLTAGLVMAYTAMEQNLNTCWLPSYGAAMRGGKANSTVKFGDTEEEIIGVPMMAEADVLVAMNRPSLDYMRFCKEGAFVIANMDIIDKSYAFPEDKKIIGVHCGELAYAVNNPKGASMVMLGAMIKATGYFTPETVKTSMCHMFEEKGKGNMNELNRKAFDAGYEAV